jgi:hypothetical protein
MKAQKEIKDDVCAVIYKWDYAKHYYVRFCFVEEFDLELYENHDPKTLPERRRYARRKDAENYALKYVKPENVRGPKGVHLSLLLH